VRMNVSGGAVRGWATGRRGIGPDELVKFAAVVKHPVEYFLSPDYKLPDDFSLRHELWRLGELVQQLTEKVGREPGFRISSDEEAIDYLRRTHNLDSEAVARIRQIVERQDRTG
ncbi:MAG: hypothetical protein M1305_00245, partial [Candidatus Marsarchaeota archaeon]|nr:hypothetical protein [Candidatus Marsarchaeota archaeon]